MKILHTSDWHLGQQLFEYDRSEEQQDFLRQLCHWIAAEQPRRVDRVGRRVSLLQSFGSRPAVVHGCAGGIS